VIGDDFPVDPWFQEFGIDATYTAPNGESSTISVILDEDEEDSLVEGVEVENRVVRVTVRSADVVDIDNRARLTIRGTIYNIAKKEPNSSKLTMLYLSVD